VKRALRIPSAPFTSNNSWIMTNTILMYNDRCLLTLNPLALKRLAFEPLNVSLAYQAIKATERRTVSRWLSLLSNTLNWLDRTFIFFFFSRHKILSNSTEITRNVLVPRRIIKRPFLYRVRSELKCYVTALIKLLKLFYVITHRFDISI
jgi:hypothetical protein